MTTCPSCGSEHMGPVPCGLSFKDRMRSVVVDQTQLETRERKNYYDREAVQDAFGPDAHEQMLEATDGLGPAKADTRGRLWHRDRHSGEYEPLTETQIDQVYLGGRTEQPGGLEPGPL